MKRFTQWILSRLFPLRDPGEVMDGGFLEDDLDPVIVVQKLKRRRKKCSTRMG